MNVKGVKVERVRLGLEFFFFTNSEEAMNVRASGPSPHLEIRTLHLESCKSFPRFHNKLELALGSQSQTPSLCVAISQSELSLRTNNLVEEENRDDRSERP